MLVQGPDDGDPTVRELELPAAQYDEALFGQGQLHGEAAEELLGPVVQDGLHKDDDDTLN